MKQVFKNVYITEEGKVYNRSNGNEIKPLGGTYKLAGANYTPSELIEIHSEMCNTTNLVATREKDNCNTTIEIVQHEKPVKHEMKHENATRDESATRRFGALNSRFKGKYLINGKEYESAHQAAKELNLAPSTIIRRCKSHKDGFDFLAL